MIHDDTNMPSLLSIIRFGTGCSVSRISGSDGIGLGTFSVLDKSKAMPIGEVSSIAADNGNCARRVSSLMVVSAKAPVTGLSLDRALSVFDTSPTSVAVVAVKTSKSWICGGKFLKRPMK